MQHSTALIMCITTFSLQENGLKLAAPPLPSSARLHKSLMSFSKWLEYQQDMYKVELWAMLPAGAVATEPLQNIGIINVWCDLLVIF